MRLASFVMVSNIRIDCQFILKKKMQRLADGTTIDINYVPNIRTVEGVGGLLWVVPWSGWSGKLSK